MSKFRMDTAIRFTINTFPCIVRVKKIQILEGKRPFLTLIAVNKIGEIKKY